LTEKLEGKTIKAQATPGGNGMGIVLNGSGFEQWSTSDTFTANAPAGLAGKSIFVFISPA
jgi:hypothetical protein